MTSIPRGLTTTLIAEFHAYPGGPPVDVLNLTLQVVNMSNGDIVLGPITTGFIHPAVGLYAYDWSVPGDLPVGSYAAVWDATDVALVPVQASELFGVVSPSSLISGPCEDWEPIWCEPLRPDRNRSPEALSPWPPRSCGKRPDNASDCVRSPCVRAGKTVLRAAQGSTTGGPVSDPP